MNRRKFLGLAAVGAGIAALPVAASAAPVAVPYTFTGMVDMGGLVIMQKAGTIWLSCNDGSTWRNVGSFVWDK